MCEELKIENKLRLSSIIKTKFNNNKVLLLKSVLFTFILGFIAHGYMYFNNALSLDALAEYVDDKRITELKVSIGRIFLPIYHRLIRGTLVLPFFTGILSLFWTSLAVFLVCKIFNFKSNLLVFITSSIFTLNLTIIVMTCAFLNDIDGNLFAMFLSVLAVYLWRNYKFGYLYAILPLVLSLGLYQSYISVTIFMILILSIMDLLNKRWTKEVIVNGLKSVLMLVISGIIYAVLLKLFCNIYGVSASNGSYNSIGQMKWLTVPKAFKLTIWSYVYVIKRLLMPTSLLPKIVVLTLHVLLFITAGVSLILYIVKTKLKLKEIILVFLLICLMPIAVAFTTILSLGVIREYMHYSVCLFYLFVLLLLRLNFGEFKKEKVNFIFKSLKPIACGIMAFILLSNVVTSNTAYTVKVFEKDANVSFMTRVVSDIEKVEGYKVGETKIAFIGYPENSIVSSSEYDEIKKVWGMQYDFFMIEIVWYYEAFFELYLMYPGKLANAVEAGELSALEEVANMPAYPNGEGIKMINGYVVVKLG